MNLLYQGLAVPTSAHTYNRRAARLLVAAAELILLLLMVAGFLPSGLQQILVLGVSLILLVDPASNPLLLLLVTLIGLAPLPENLSLTVLVIILIAAMMVGRKHGRVGLYALMALPLMLVLQYLGYSFAAAPLVLLLLGAPPFQKWLPDLYLKYRSTGVLVSFIAVSYLYSSPASYAAIAPLLLFLGVLMMIMGIFQGMICKSFPEFFSNAHKIAFGLLLISASSSELQSLFLYLLLPTALSLAVINYIHDTLSEETSSSMFDFGGLSSVMRVEAASTLMTYLVLFSLVSIGAETMMRIGIGGNIGFVLLGCALLFVAAASLAVFFRSYTLVFEGSSRNGVASDGGLKLVAATLSTCNLLTAMFPGFMLLAFSLVGGGKSPQFEALNSLLFVMLVAVVLSAVFTWGMKSGKTKSWMTGYASVEDLKGSRGEIFTSWKEIFKPIYDIGVPDDGVSQALERISPLIPLTLLVILAILVVIV